MRLAAALTVAVAFGCGPKGTQPTASSPREGSDVVAGTDAPTGEIPNVLLEQVGGKPARLTDFHTGKPMVVAFWATWCSSCKAELRYLKSLQKKFDGLTVVAVSLDEPETVAQVPTVIRRMKISYPVLIDRETQLVARINPRKATPYTVIYDGSGNVLMSRQGYSPADASRIEGLVAPLFAN